MSSDRDVKPLYLKEEWPDDYLPILTRRALYVAYSGRDAWCRTLEAELANCATRIHNQRAEINRLLASAAMAPAAPEGK